MRTSINLEEKRIQVGDRVFDENRNSGRYHWVSWADSEEKPYEKLKIKTVDSKIQAWYYNPKNKAKPRKHGPEITHKECEILIGRRAFQWDSSDWKRLGEITLEELELTRIMLALKGSER